MASEQWHWTFYGFETPARSRPVRDWINGLTDDERDELTDVLVYMQVRPNYEWPTPQHFKPLEDELSEVRFTVEKICYRIYGINLLAWTLVLHLSSRNKQEGEK